MSRPNVASLTSLPLRTPYTQDHRPSSPLTQSRTAHADTYITHGSSRQDTGSSHKKIYSVDSSSHTAKLVAETDTLESPRLRDSGYGAVTSGRSSYHPSNSSSSSSKPSARHAHADLGDNGYSYTDPASMYRDTEPAWRRPRAGSVERGSRPSSMIVDRPPRTSTRELGPPPSTRGFDKINGAIPRSSARSNSIERRSDRLQDPYSSDSGPHRSSSTRHAPAVHQEPPRERETRRAETYDDYGRSRETEPKRHSTHDRAFEDHQVASRGFGIATGPPPVHDPYVDRQPLHPPPEPQRAPPVEYAPSAYQSDRGAESRMPEPRRPERPVSSYDSYEPPRPERPREHRRDDSRQEPNRESRAVPVAAGAIAGMAATAGIAAAAGKAKERERERDERGSSEERERQRRREYDERDRRDDRYEDRERRERAPEDRRDDRRREPERREALPPPPPPLQPPPPVAAPAYAMAKEAERPTSRDRPYPNEENPPPKPPRKTSPEESEIERPRHYVERESDRGRKEPAPPVAAIDPDEEYRRRIAQAEKEAEQSRRAAADRQDSDSDGGRRRRRDRGERGDRERSRSRSRGRDERSRGSPPSQATPRYNDRDLVEEPESFDRLNPDAPGKSVQIVVPRKDQSPPIKGILRKPTEKFPEDPEPIREGVAPHKDAQKGKDIPVGARWTRIDRKLVNPEALERAKERFEERQDCVIVLRVLTKEEIQKLADKTKAIREERGMFC